MFDGRIAYTTPGPTRFGFALDGDYQQYRLLGADVPNVTRRAAEPDRPHGRRQRLRRLGRARPRALPRRRPLRLDRLLGGRDPATSFDSGVPPGSFDQTESRFEADGGVQIDRVRLDAAGAFSGLGDEGIGASLKAYSAGGTLRLTLGRGVLDVGARLLGYDASATNGGGTSQNIGPVVSFDVPVSPTARLYLRNEPSVVRRGLAGLFRDNPYAVPEPVLAPDIHVVDGDAGLEIQSRSVRFTVYAGGRYSPVALHFVRNLRSATAGLYDVRYAEEAVLRGGGSVTLYAPNGLRVTLGAEVRSGTLPDTEQDIPYFAPVVGELSLALPFAEGRGLVQVTGSAESARPREAPLDKAPAWATLDAEAHYLFSPGIGAFLRAERLAGRAEQWPGYPRPPAALLAGLRVQW